jgi:hypothetical protein
VSLCEPSSEQNRRKERRAEQKRAQQKQQKRAARLEGRTLLIASQQVKRQVITTVRRSVRSLIIAKLAMNCMLALQALALHKLRLRPRAARSSSPFATATATLPPVQFTDDQTNANALVHVCLPLSLRSLTASFDLLTVHCILMRTVTCLQSLSLSSHSECN